MQVKGNSGETLAEKFPHHENIFGQRSVEAAFEIGLRQMNDDNIRKNAQVISCVASWSVNPFHHFSNKLLVRIAAHTGNLLITPFEEGKRIASQHLVDNTDDSNLPSLEIFEILRMLH